MRWERPEMCERNTVEKANGNPKVFHRLIRSRVSVMEQITRLKGSEARVVETTEEIYMRS